MDNLNTFKTKIFSILVSILFLNFAGAGVLYWTTSQHRADGLTINLAGAQRMLSQLITKETLKVQLGKGNLYELVAYSSRFDDVLNGLIHGDDVLGLPPCTDKKTLQQLNIVKSIWLPFRQSIKDIGFEKGNIDLEVEQILKRNMRLLHSMDLAVKFFEEQADRRINRMSFAQLLMVLSVFILVSIAWINFILPAFYSLSKAYDDLAVIARKEKEAKDALKLKTRQLIQTEKMGAVGTMAAGVAHELNNPMMGILNYIQYCLKHTSEGDRRYNVLQDTEREIKRCTDIVSNLLTFSRMDNEGEETPQMADCAEIFERVLSLLSYRIKKEQVIITKCYDEYVPGVCLKVNHIQQVFLNLLDNSLDAFQEKECDKKEIGIKIKYEPDYLNITVEDNGGGIVSENLSKLFEPFFTTKPPGKGTGLGLSISLGIIEEHGGEILCESELGAGSKFKISLPINSEKLELESG